MRVVALSLLIAGAAFVTFAVVNALLLYFAGVPKASLNITAPLLGQTITAKISGVPDPYAVGTAVVRGVILLAIGLIGAKLLEVGLGELRRQREERSQTQYYEYYQYQQY